MLFIKLIKYTIERRRQLARMFNFRDNWEMWSESCIPSYCHRNIAAAYLSWWRLFVAVKMAGGANLSGEILDFGSSIGELCRLIPRNQSTYRFVEKDDRLATILIELNPDAQRERLESSSGRQFDVIFALDALEHNVDYPLILSNLASKLSPEGKLVLSGPTENWMYRLGRWIAGFHNHYHHTCIYDIEKEAEKHMTCVRLRNLPPVMPLFRLSVWKFKNG